MFHNVDLHSHSTVSDGTLSPSELAARAQRNGVDCWALTDHDEITGLTEAQAAAVTYGLHWVPGVEISVSWGDDQTVHILGLAIDPNCSALCHGLAQVRAGRDQRAHLIGQALAEAGIADAYKGALRYAGNAALISRAHFARYIVALGLVKETGLVFDRWLAKGKPGYVPHLWASLADAVGWIHTAGGVAVVAHPSRYRISKKELRELLSAFKELGGEGLEVVSGCLGKEEIREMASLARHYGFAAARGSDFHDSQESWADIGKAPQLPDGLTPIWQHFS